MQERRLTAEEYEALLTMARKGAVTPNEKRVLAHYVEMISAANGLSVSQLFVQWQDAHTPLPATARFPSKWPPEWRAVVRIEGREVAQADVMAVVEAASRQPINILVTRDPGGELGWTKLKDFFPHG